MIVPTRQTQPYRRQLGRPQNPVLAAMLAGRPAHLPNPMDVYRQGQRRSALASALLYRR